MDLAERIKILGNITKATYEGTAAARSIAQHADIGSLALVQPLIKAFDDLIKITQVQNGEIHSLSIALANRLTERKREGIQECLDECDKYLENPSALDSDEAAAVKYLRNEFKTKLLHL